MRQAPYIVMPDSCDNDASGSDPQKPCPFFDGRCVHPAAPDELREHGALEEVGNGDAIVPWACPFRTRWNVTVDAERIEERTGRAYAAIGQAAFGVHRLTLLRDALPSDDSRRPGIEASISEIKIDIEQMERRYPGIPIPDVKE